MWFIYSLCTCMHVFEKIVLHGDAEVDEEKNRRCECIRWCICMANKKGTTAVWRKESGSTKKSGRTPISIITAKFPSQLYMFHISYEKDFNIQSYSYICRCFSHSVSSHHHHHHHLCVVYQFFDTWLTFKTHFIMKSFSLALLFLLS